MTTATTKLTADTITDDEIRALGANAARAGDTKQVMICDVALGVADANPDGSDPTEEDIEAARAECAKVINAGRAMAD